MKRPDKGFTIIELMVTVAVASILVLVGVPSIMDLVRNNRLSAQANDLLSSISLARAEALKRQRQVVLCRSRDAGDPDVAAPLCGRGGSWDEGWMVFVNQNAAEVPAQFTPGQDTILFLRGSLSGSNNLVGNGNTAVQLVFLPSGVVGAGGIGNFLLQDVRGMEAATTSSCTAGTRLICLGMTGRARIYNNGWLSCDGARTC